MTNRELEKADVRVTGNNRKGVYQMTAVGRPQLTVERAGWERTASIIHALREPR